MRRNTQRPVRPGIFAVLLAALPGLPIAAVAGEVPASVVALFPAGTTLGHGDWSLMPTEFGKSFAGDAYASSFRGQRPSCDLAAVPEIGVHLKGDTAFENPPMLEMAVAEYDQGVARAAPNMAAATSSYATTVPNVVSVGQVQTAQRPNGNLVFLEFKEDCKPHPNGSKTMLRGFARRGATQLEFNMILAVSAAEATAMADEILANFQKLDIAALTK